MPNKTIAVEITDASITAVELSGGPGGLEICRWGTEPLPKDDRVAFIKKLWQQKKFTTTRVIVMLPGSLARYRTLALPILPEEQVNAAIRVEMESRAGRDDIWRVIGRQPQDGRMNVRMALVADPQLNRFLDILRQAGLEVLWSGFKSRGLQNFILFHQDFLETETARYAYLDLAEDHSEYGVVTADNLCYRRDLELGDLDFSGADPGAAQNDLLMELGLSLASSQSTGQEPTNRLWLFGVNAKVLHGLKKALTQSGWEVVLPEKTNLRGVMPSERVAGLAPLIGLALDELGWNTQKNLRIHTLEQQRQGQARAKLNWALKLALVGGFLVLGVWLLTQAKLMENRKRQEWIAGQTGKLTQLQQAEERTRKALQKIGRLERWTDGQGRELELLYAWQQQLPEGTLITDLTMEEGKVKNLAGTTPSVSWLLTKLAADPVLKNLQLKGNIMRADNGMESFQLEEKTGIKEPEPK
jgi:Tfp pilus assembly PilM family ATPase